MRNIYLPERRAEDNHGTGRHMASGAPDEDHVLSDRYK